MAVWTYNLSAEEVEAAGSRGSLATQYHLLCKSQTPRAWLQSKTDRKWLLTSECCAHRSEPQRSQWETSKHSAFIQSPPLKAQIKCGRGGEEKDCRSQRWWWTSPSKQYLPDTTALIAAWTYTDCSGMHRLKPGKISALRSESGHAYGCRACIISLLSIFFLGFWLLLFVDLFDLRRRERFSFFSFCWVFCLLVFESARTWSSVGKEVGRIQKERGKNQSKYIVKNFLLKWNKQGTEYLK